jgi:hypothetical protein
MLDTDFAIQRIIQAGIQETQARAIIREIVDAQTDLVSKRDLKEAIIDLKVELKIDIADLKHDMKFINLKIMGLYAFMAIIASGVAKLVFQL